MTRTVAALFVVCSLSGVTSATADEPDVGAGQNEFVAISEETQSASLLETAVADPVDSTTNIGVTYVLDPVCVRGEGISGDSFYGCAGQQRCGTDGELFLIQAMLPDGSTSAQGTTCIEPGDPTAATAPVLTPGRILEAFRRIPLPHAPLEIQPPGGETLVNFDTILHTQAEPFQETVQLLGRQITFNITPATFTWTLGNGESMTTTDPGQPWTPGTPMDAYVSHRYTQAGPVTLQLTTTWTARWRLGNGPWRDVDGTVTMTSPAQDLQVRTAQPQLVSYD
ncbi:hypothetical protein NOK12_11760 [Nocardioides sp. OK12]|uniref:hypothetical protein n=1 Tax=Nocardioides sp. OK12 TaxID=2758661 RepID=UPI0021C3BE4B|nr:hypothetical protein [Nocardioides sp. OK12]GHJ58658.1 hypothetical protein NOK12_11760 [Nocardioides sp. OK12]